MRFSRSTINFQPIDYIFKNTFPLPLSSQSECSILYCIYIEGTILPPPSPLAVQKQQGGKIRICVFLRQLAGGGRGLCVLTSLWCGVLSVGHTSELLRSHGNPNILFLNLHKEEEHRGLHEVKKCKG